MKLEQWRSVIGFEGVYEVSNLGCVRSLPRMASRRNGRPYPVKGTIRATPLVVGYPALQLKCNGTMVNFYVHELVAEAFIGPRPTGKEVAHGDGNKQNAALSNLRYATAIENDADKIRHGTRMTGSKNGHAKLNEDQVSEIRSRSAAGEKGNALAAEFGISTATMANIRLRKLWRHV